MGIQLIVSFIIVFMYVNLRKSGNTDEMVLMSSFEWFKSLNIYYTVGVDGISVAMIALTSMVVFAGVFASWEMEDLKKEFFISLIHLSTGVFDSSSRSTFHDDPLLRGGCLPRNFLKESGQRAERVFSHEADLMLMGGSALLMVGLFRDLPSNSAPDGGELTFNFWISKIPIPIEAQRGSSPSRL
jgi:NADH-quinone oxidoreductase subunit M